MSTPSGTLETSAITHDTLLRGRVQLFQPARGFRSSLDPVLLAGWLAPPFGRFLDIGCGTGALSFLLLARDPAARGVGIEVQPRLAELGARGVSANGFEGRFRLVTGDVRQVDPAGADESGFDLVVSNPPFRPLGAGELPPDEEKRVAHHEVKLRLSEWLGRAAELVQPGARVAVVFPAARAGELLAGLTARQLQPVRLRMVHPRKGAAATRVLVEARRSAEPVPLVSEPPLQVHADDGYSPEVRAMLGEGEGGGQ